MKYRTPEAFKTALLDRLKKESESRKIPFVRVQMRFLFERLMVRAAAAFPEVVVKGGAAMEFRLDMARTTRDLDLGIYKVRADQMLPTLQESARADFGDYLTFEVEDDPHHSVLEAEGMEYQGRRLRVRARLAGKPLFSYFGVDIAVGEAAAPPDSMTIPSLFAGAGLQPLDLVVYALESHIAEKLHAYTLPRQNLNSRVKDLPDLGLLAMHRPIQARELRRALEATFGHRKTHTLPSSLPAPPTEWELPYAAMSRENSLPWTSLSEGWTAAASFLEPILAGEEPGLWNPAAWEWEAK